VCKFLGPKRHKELSILDIALVTTLDVPSNMGLEGKPSAVGAPSGERRTAPSSGRLWTSACCSRNSGSKFSSGAIRCARPGRRAGGRECNLIIDDCLHKSEVNLNTLLFGLPLIKNNGVLFIEDIGLSDLPFWQIVFGLLSPRYGGTFLDARGGYVVLIRPSAP